ncbi:MAG: RHS repeat-associated core domain-containing protein [Acidobacteriota bacterium]
MTTTRSILRPVAIVLVTLLVASAADAQEPPAARRGLSADTAYQLGDLDHVNLFNGALTVTLPIGQSYPVGPSFSYQLVLAYASNGWDQDEDNGCIDRPSYSLPIDDPRATAGFGWTLHLGQLYPPETKPFNDRDFDWVFVSPDGGQHAFSTELHPNAPSPPQTDTWFTTDGTYLRLRLLGDGACEAVVGTTNQCATVESTDGLTREFRNFGTLAAPAWRLTRVVDRFDNDLDVRYPDLNTWRLEDVHGRVHFVRFTGGFPEPGSPGGRVASVELETFGGQTSTWTLTHTPTTIDRQRFDRPACAPPDQTETLTVPLLTRIEQPDDSFYDLEYSTSDAPLGDVLSGGLLAMRLPTGGAYRYTYQDYDFNSFAPDELDANPYKISYGIATRSIDLDDDPGTVLGTWTYAYETNFAGPLSDPDVPCFHRQTVTDPLGHQTVHYFSTVRAFKPWAYGLPIRLCDETGTSESAPYLSQELYEGSVAAGMRVRTVRADYTADGDVPSEKRARNARQTVRQMVYDDDGGKTTTTTFSDFAGFGHWRTVERTGDFTTLVGSKTLTTDYHPETGTLLTNPGTGAQTGASTFVIPAATTPWVWDRWDETRVTETLGASAQTSVRQFCFDGATGFLERQRQLAGTAPAARDVVTVFSQEAGATGRVALERTWGGDGQAILGTGGLCGLSLPNQDEEYRLRHEYASGVVERSFFVDPCSGADIVSRIDQEIDASTGLPSRVFDVAGVGTSLVYDRMSRRVRETPDESAIVETVYTFPTTAQPSRVNAVKTKSCPPGVPSCGDSQALSWEYHEFDQLGRRTITSARYPSVSSLTTFEDKTFVYNPLGWILEERTWGGGASRATTYSNYDRFGRVGTLDPSGGTNGPTHFSYDGERVTHRETRIVDGPDGASSQVFTSEVHDHFGRLIALCEDQDSTLSGGCQDLLTRYTYDEQNRLVRVCQAVSSQNSTGCGQTRTFAYDGRGFLLSETHPEIGPSGNGSTSYSFDSRGNVLTRRIAGGAAFDLDYSYDPAGRLLRVEDGQGRPLKTFAYGSENVGLDRRRGKLVQARRYNWVSPTGPLALLGVVSGTVTDRYEFAGRDGRISEKVTSFRLDRGTSAWRTRWTYDPLGNVSSLEYPRCRTWPCRDRDPARQIDFSYSDGYLTEVDEFADAIRYQLGGRMLHTIAHSNGVTWTQTFDPTARLARPHTIATSNVVGTSFATGTYQYDAAGNIWQIGAQQFQYDGLSRLTRGEVPLGAGERVQSASYDVYGNLTGLATDGQAQSLAPSASTNRLTGAGIAYDAAGNLTALRDGGADFAYGYDPLSMMETFQSSDLARVYFYDANDERLFAWDCPQDSCGPNSTFERWTVRGLGGEILRVYEGPDLASLQWQEDYVYRGAQLLAAVRATDTGEATQHIHLDHLGSTRQVTDANRVEVARHTYYPFGDEATSTTSGDLELKFTGHERERNGGGAGLLDYMHARHCSPVLGRFLSFDPLGGNPRTPQSWNRYTYTLNNPLRFTDPRGLAPEETFFDSITVTARAERFSLDVPTWLFHNFYLDVTPHFDGGRFAVSNGTFDAWSAWDTGGGCDAWCQIFADVGESATAVTYMEFGLSGIFLGAAGGGFLSKGPEGPYALLNRSPLAGGGGSLLHLGAGQANRIQNAATRLRQPITLVGSRASGTAQALSDFDFVVVGASSRVRHSAASSLPAGPRLGIGQPRNQDIFSGRVDFSQPHIVFLPGGGN